MKHIVTGLFTAAILATGAQAQTNIVVGHALSPTSHYGVGAQAFIDTLTELSGGAFTGEQAPAGQLGGERDMIEGLQIGSLDVVVTSTGPLGNFVPEIFALDLPFLFRDYDHARAVLDGDIGQELLAKSVKTTSSVWRGPKTASATSPIRSARSQHLPIWMA